MKVHELITMLQQYDASAEVTVTWEGTTQTPNVYQAADRRVMIDADNNDYKLKWQQINTDSYYCTLFDFLKRLYSQKLILCKYGTAKCNIWRYRLVRN